MKINLIPDVIQKRRRDARIKRLTNLALMGWLVGLGVVVLLMLGFLGIQKLSLRSAENKKQELDARVNSEENVAFRREALEVQASLNALKDLFNRQRKFSTALDSLAALTPSGVRVRDFALTEDNRVTITGHATSYVEAGKMVVAMKQSESKQKDEPKAHFATVAMGGASQSESGVDFSITASYVDPVLGGGQ